MTITPDRPTAGNTTAHTHNHDGDDDADEDSAHHEISPSVTINLRFPGQYFDQETGLHYNWNRYYNPKTGRYITSDPVGLGGGLNSYTYVSNNPLNWADPLGLDRFQICEDFGPSGQKVCHACVSAVCSIPGIDKGCCKIDFDACIGQAGGDPAQEAICVTQFTTCNLQP